ncbi:hypothetical protein [Roseomonas rosulenta]|uniref:hypothetical protein n=1 Tax=Roseomonas rosulenta TaxID=2748667 RepID=UPI0018DFD935|nr:hypothetical protein [Roseomonas rosulenta]
MDVRDRNIAVFRFADGRLPDTSTRIAADRGPAAIRTAGAVPAAAPAPAWRN